MFLLNKKITCLQVLVVCALFCTMFHLPVKGQESRAVRNAKISLKLQNVTVETVLDTLTKISKARFFFNHEQINVKSKVSIDYKEQSLERIVLDLFSAKSVEITYQPNGLILLKPKDRNSRVYSDVPSFKINGIVINASNKEPLPGAGIIINDNKATGITTNTEGLFAIEVAEGTKELMISYMGFQDEIVNLEDYKSNLVIELTPIMNELQDVVITGMTPRKSDTFTGSYITVKGADLMKLNPNNLLDALQFFDPSFRIVQNNSRGSDPNAMPEFKLRGDAQLGAVQSSDLQMLLGDYSNRPNMPLLILDGFEASLQRIVDLDPERVESITILKDAAATAIYGSRAANGVIVFETKKPLPGKINISYSMNYGLSVPDLRDYNLMNASEKLEYERLAGLFPDNNVPQLNYYNQYKSEILKGVDTYWLSAPVQTAHIHRHTLSMQGGDQAIRYNLGVNYGSQPGVIKQSGRTSMGLSFNLQYRRKAWNISNQLTLNDTKGVNSPFGSFSQYSRMNPYYRMFDNNGNYTKYLDDKYLGAGTQREQVFNPLYNTQFPHKDFNKNFNTTENLSIEWNPTERLRWSTNATFTKGMGQSEKFISRNNTIYEFEDDLSKRGSYTKNTGDLFSWNVNTSLNYNYNKGNHLISSFIRGEISESKSNAVNLEATGFPSDSMTDFLFGYEMNQRPSGGETTVRTLGTVGQLSYMYDNKYAADFSVRGDISSQFGAETGMAPFWASGVRWNVDRETWMKKSGFNALVLRASMGVTGSQNYSPYQAIETYTFSNLMFPYLSSDVLGAELMALGNNELGWSTTKDRTVSLEFAVLKNRLSGSFSYYNNYTDNLLLDYTLAPSTGFESITMNAGALENKGMDGQLSFTPIADYGNRLQWVISANAAHNRNTIKKISNVLKKMNETNLQRTDAPLPIYEEGKSTTQLFTVRSLGIDPATGQEVYLKRDGNKTFIWNPADKVSVGDTEPRVRGSLTNSFIYKNLSIALAMQYEYGAYRYNSTLVDKLENTSIAYNLDKRALDGRWSENNRDALYKSISILGSETPQSSRFVQKFNEFSLGSVAVGYRFDPKDMPFLKRNKIGSVSMNFSMQDVFRFSTVEQERGLDYPFARSYNLSLSFLFN